jgi:predicted transglutaminase-like cysteine proteinase
MIVCLEKFAAEVLIRIRSIEGVWMGKASAALSFTAIGVLLSAAALAAATDLGYSRSLTPGLAAHFDRLFGGGARGRLEGWKDFVRRAADRPEPSRAGDKGLLAPVNGFFNRVPSVSDQDHWGAADYWATPAEFLASNGGDCEDYAIAKYFTLKELGVPVSRLRLVYARGWKGGAHMVLTYHSAPGAEPLVMDNLEGGIRPASERPDLIPVYSFNDDDLLLPRQGLPTIQINTGAFRLWRVVLDKLARELTY